MKKLLSMALLSMFSLAFANFDSVAGAAHEATQTAGSEAQAATNGATAGQAGQQGPQQNMQAVEGSNQGNLNANAQGNDMMPGQQDTGRVGDLDADMQADIADDELDGMDFAE